MFNIFVNGITLKFEQTDSSVLDVMLSQDDESKYHYECKQGHCGACRMKLTSGTIHYTEAPLAFLRENEVLLCIAKPTSDIILE